MAARSTHRYARRFVVETSEKMVSKKVRALILQIFTAANGGNREGPRKSCRDERDKARSCSLPGAKRSRIENSSVLTGLTPAREKQMVQRHCCLVVLSLLLVLEKQDTYCRPTPAPPPLSVEHLPFDSKACCSRFQSSRYSLRPIVFGLVGRRARSMLVQEALIHAHVRT